MAVRLMRNIASRFLLSSLLLLLFIVSANAYTLVLRDGRRMEVPSNFVVTPSTLTYEVQQGIQITVQVATIDISATEKANSEEPGAFLRRAVNRTVVNESVPGKSAAKKTITNSDLEATARRRVASERAYDKRIKELGLPSLAESRRKAETAATIAQEELHERVAAERQTEEYWRARAIALRTEISAVDAEIQFVRAKLDEVPYPNWSGGFTSFSSFGSFISFGGIGGVGRGRHVQGTHSRAPGVYSAPTGLGPQLSGRVNFGRGNNRSRVFINPGRTGRGGLGGLHPGRWSGGHARTGTGIGIGIGILPTTTVFGSTAAYDYSYERSELITRFNDLAATRAGLNARWRELEEEARRAGAPPGWLRR